MSTLLCEEAERARRCRLVVAGSLLLFDRHRLQRIALFNGIDHVLAARHVAEDGVLAVEVRLGGSRDEELAAVRVGAGVGHREDARLVRERIALDLVVELVPGAAATRARGIARLHHKPLNDAVKRRAVIEALVGEEGEVVDGVRGVLRIELELDGALAGLQGRLVDSVRVNLKLGGRVPLRVIGHGGMERSAERASANAAVRRGDGRGVSFVRLAIWGRAGD